MLYQGERTLNAIEHDLRLEAVLTEVLALGRKAVFGQLLWYQNYKRWKPNAARCAFKEIYGEYPRPKDCCAPICAIGSPLEHWIALRPKRPRAVHHEVAPQRS
jgi:hypothetical protein